MPGTEALRAALSDRYSIEKEIGSGGMATVYLARDLKHDREVALKVLRSDLSAVIGTERFLSEVRITARLDHPHILTLIDSGEASGILYYVLPYVRGESLRAKLEREKQLSIDEALSITKQVASALDYAHSHGVVHRDIKPENILLHEGEAVLADFGIALAVKEAGGNRLTETGLSLGTPQYMSPEQATGDRALDKRSDIYSLGAVFYEMLGGEPPVTGGTAQAMVAKLLTEKPVKLRVLRDTVPFEIERATEKALAKVPADRFTSAGEFARALSAAPATESKPANNRKLMWIGAAAGVVVAVASGIIVSQGRDSEPPRAPVTLRDRVQLTNTGNVAFSGISDDGKAIAYVVNDCSKTGCRYAIELKDVGGTVSRRVLDGATAIYRAELSPDRRHILALGSINGVYGSWLVSLVGGPPRFILSGMAGFFASGDSLVMTRIRGPAKSYWLLISGLDGVISDSMKIDAEGDRAPFPFAIPRSTRLAYSLPNRNSLDVGIVERDGTLLSSRKFPGTPAGGASASADALWIYLSPPISGNVNIMRLPFDPKSMKLAARGDTVYAGNTGSMSVTEDGGTLVYDDGVTDYSGWLLPLDDMVNDRFAADKRVFRATGFVRGAMSPDGSMTVIGRDHPQGGREYTVVIPGSLAETPIPGRHRSVIPQDSSVLKITDATDSTTTLYLYDWRTRRRTAARTIRSGNLVDNTRVGDAWVWIPTGGTSIEMQGDSEPRPRRVPLPRWYKDVYWVSGSPDGKKLAIMGWQAPSEDSLGVAVISLEDGSSKQVYTTFGEGGGTSWLADGSLVVFINDTPESESLYHVKEGQPVRRLGSTPRLISRNSSVMISRDMKKTFVITRDDRRDVWMSKVVK